MTDTTDTTDIHLFYFSRVHTRWPRAVRPSQPEPDTRQDAINALDQRMAPTAPE